ncbi:hypothetical protein V493_00570 [Pseudogymnoascus sp. VKM F-4281 (FW-2241)]|nr:hypothetical protein V493_00570 [Pseudogymnoascus sp. VKM F-4281 (FW-2241)]
MSGMIKLFVARYDEGKVYKHWSLFVENPGKEFIIHVIGSAGNWKFEEKRRNPRVSKTLIELIDVTEIHVDQIPELRRAAQSVPLDQNRQSSFDCQNFVLMVIDKAIEEELIQVSGSYLDSIFAKRDGL